ncbi:morphogenetic protein [Klebsiella aerogenes]|uniref:morphogenetic protein n=1 Tax=Klebsiella aerogenes TaxID=548 RepID=UPI001BD18331|nr:morphogenetic protein [Klebsiella aerogenes]
MKERGMIFNAEMVRAILDGRKTQTRRIVKGADGAVKFCKEWDINGKEVFVVLGGKDHTGMNPVLGAISCPFGAVGDRIWVRETFQGPLVHEELFEEYRAYPEKFETPEYCEYAADGGVRPEYCDLDDNLRHGWLPSIHMPRWASRILLEITGVRVERLNAISEEDAMREGIDADILAESQDNYDCIADHNMTGRPTAKGYFSDLWQSIYGVESWEANPWVWVIEFKRVEGGAA